MRLPTNTWAGRRAATLAALAALAGCAPTLPVVVQPISCDISAEVLARRCAAPQLIPDGVSYGQVLQSYQTDRKSLRDCAAHDQLLADMIVACQGTIRQYNEKLVEINRTIANKP